MAVFCEALRAAAVACFPGDMGGAFQVCECVLRAQANLRCPNCCPNCSELLPESALPELVPELCPNIARILPEYCPN